MAAGLKRNFLDVSVNVVDCPDLMQPPWHLAAPGELLFVPTYVYMCMYSCCLQIYNPLKFERKLGMVLKHAELFIISYQMIIFRAIAIVTTNQNEFIILQFRDEWGIHYSTHKFYKLKWLHI